MLSKDKNTHNLPNCDLLDFETKKEFVAEVRRYLRKKKYRKWLVNAVSMGICAGSVVLKSPELNDIIYDALSYLATGFGAFSTVRLLGGAHDLVKGEGGLVNKDLARISSPTGDGIIATNSRMRTVVKAHLEDIYNQHISTNKNSLVTPNAQYDVAEEIVNAQYNFLQSTQRSFDEDKYATFFEKAFGYKKMGKKLFWPMLEKHWSTTSSSLSHDRYLEWTSGSELGEDVVRNLLKPN